MDDPEHSISAINALLRQAQGRAAASKHQITVTPVDRDGRPVVEVFGQRLVRDGHEPVTALRLIDVPVAIMTPSRVIEAIEAVEADLDAFY